MIRVLQVVNNMHRAGLETMLMNYYRNIDRTKIQFDFLTHRPEKGDYDDEIISMGGKVYYAPRLYPQNYLQYFKWMKKFFNEHPEYKIIHSHIDSMSYLPLLAAKLNNIPIRIAHSHNTSIDKDFKLPLKLIFKKLLPNVATNFCTCGKEAGEFLFPNKKSTFIPNAIDIKKFLYNEKIRTCKRKELGIENKFVIGNIGRLSYQKNHKFLIEIFSEILKKEKESILLIIGIGEKEKELKKQVRNFNIEKNVYFLGKRDDVNELYHAMDVFVMPSFFEGVPVVGIEAQFSGLPCIFSDKVPKETKFEKNIIFISLNASVEIWCNEILKIKNESIKRNLINYKKSIYNIQNARTKLEEMYLNLEYKYYTRRNKNETYENKKNC